MDGKLVVVADLGHMKAYRLDDDTRFSAPHLELMEEWQMDAHRLPGGTATGNAGRFDTGAIDESDTDSDTEAQHATIERRFRAVKFLARRIEHLMIREHVEKLFLAADSGINRPILEQVNASVRSKIEKNVRADLSRVRPDELLQHFCT